MAGVSPLVAARTTAAAEQSERRFDELASLISAKMAEHRVPGMAYGVMKNGQVTTRGFGVTDIEDLLPVVLVQIGFLTCFAEVRQIQNPHEHWSDTRLR